MVEPQSVVIGAGAVYAVLIHMALVWKHAKLKASQDSLSASEADIAQEAGG